MKKLFLLAATFIVTMTATAQVTFAEDGDDNFQESIGINDPRKSTMSVGLKVGGNYSTMSKYDDVDLGLKGSVGFEAGIVLSAHFGKRTKASDPGTGALGVQIEALYSQHTIKTNLDENLKLSYFEVPILAKYYFLPNFNIEAGLCVAGILSASPDKLTANLNEPWPGRQSVTFSTGDFKGFDIRPAIGLAYSASNTGLSVGARYYIGTSDMAKNFPCKMNTIEVALAYSFNIFKF